MTMKVTQPNVLEPVAIVDMPPRAQANCAFEPSAANVSRLQTKLLTFAGGLLAILLAGVTCFENATLAQQENVSTPPLLKMPLAEEEQLAF